MNTAELLQIAGALAATLALIALCAALVRRLGLAPVVRSGKVLEVLGSSVFSSKERVVLLQVEQERLLLGVSSAGISVLHRLPPNPHSMPGAGERG